MGMRLDKIAEITKSEILSGINRLKDEAEFAFATDLMSEVLTIDTDKLLLITGLTNIQAIRTAEMSDIKCILFIRNKNIPEEIIKLAEENDIVTMKCSYTMFKTSGLLFRAGLKPIF